MSLLEGTIWVFNENPVVPSELTENIGIGSEGESQTVFKSDDTLFYAFYCYNSSDVTHINYGNGPGVMETGAYLDSWENESYKTIEFIAEPDFYSPDKVTAISWLMANATCLTQTNYTASDIQLKMIADSIRSKTGSAESIEFMEGFISSIESIASGMTATADKIRNGYTAYTQDGTVTGTLKAYDILNATNIISASSSAIYMSPIQGTTLKAGGVKTLIIMRSFNAVNNHMVVPTDDTPIDEFMECEIVKENVPEEIYVSVHGIRSGSYISLSFYVRNDTGEEFTFDNDARIGTIIHYKKTQ